MPKVFEFEIEHVFSQSLFDDPRIKPILEQYGFRQQHRANQVGLYSNSETVAALQSAPPEVRDIYKDAGWGANRQGHRQFQAGGEGRRPQAPPDHHAAGRCRDAEEDGGGEVGAE